ncbi:MAG: NADPH-dependent 7-cyano-7-deazaguanine reductase QueF [Spirochaetes bacterium RBG_16_49_21]|nr:MAG: NADPH-dependent 7-cyano-7-deazaguanine reductase QueF [Spirochaetes bacterium RBG_16_49_21]
MPVAEGKMFEFESEERIRADFLETIDYDGNPQEITYETGEFSAVCPFSGLPDIGTIVIVYIPGNKIVELKSLKYYLISFRNVGIYQEAATNRIYNDLYVCLKPRQLMVKSIYNIRGGIASTCVMDSERMRNAG